MKDITYGIEVTLAQNRNYMLADGFFRLARQRRRHSTVPALPGPGRTPLPARGGGIRAVEEAGAGAAKNETISAKDPPAEAKKTHPLRHLRSARQTNPSGGQACWPV
jgi:hypothetical protein